MLYQLSYTLAVGLPHASRVLYADEPDGSTVAILWHRGRERCAA